MELLRGRRWKRATLESRQAPRKRGEGVYFRIFQCRASQRSAVGASLLAKAACQSIKLRLIQRFREQAHACSNLGVLLTRRGTS
jgi:hypothetical protein